jgi:hypothetical protein
MVGNQFAGRTLYRRSRDEFLSRRSKAPAPRAPQPPAGAFLFWHLRPRPRRAILNRRLLPRSAKRGNGGARERSYRKQIKFWQHAKRRCFWTATPKPPRTSTTCLSLPELGRELHYGVDLDRLTRSVPRNRLKRRSLGEAVFLATQSRVADTKNSDFAKQPERPRCGHCRRPREAVIGIFGFVAANPWNLR